MLNLQNVRSKPSLPSYISKIYFLDILFNKTAQGIYPYIFVPKSIFDNLKSAKPNLYHQSLIIHEQTHLDRQRTFGWLKWMMGYLTNSKFRLDEELIANKMQMRFMKKNKLKFPFEMKAKMLSGWIYLWPISYNAALKELKIMWNKA